MGYYHIQLIKNASNLCKIILPCEKHYYKRLPMGVANYPDISQQNMNDLFHVFKSIRAFIDKILILTRGDWTYHAQRLKRTLNKLKEKGIKCNIEKSLFGKTEMEYLGFWVTRDGIKPRNKKLKK